MEDLTTGPLTRHLLKTTGFMLVMMVFQTLYFLIDLYWVGRLGTDAIAGVAISGNLTFVVLALTQMLGIGTTAVMSHAVGRKDHEQAHLLFNQSQVLAMIIGGLYLIVGLALVVPYTNAMAADAETARLARSYLFWFVPAMALQFLLVAIGAALRGTGNFKPGMLVSTGSVIVNMVLAPFLIFGWVTGHAFGVAGAAISSLISIVFAIVWLAWYLKGDTYLRIDTSIWKPQLAVWKRVLAIGFPTGFEFAMTALYMMLVYATIRPFGATAQAAFGVGGRVIQALFMPAVALGFSVAPVAGQNFGAGKPDRVKRTFQDGAYMVVGVMLLLAAACHFAPHAFVRLFSNDPEVLSYATDYLRIVSWTFVPSGLIFVTSSMFQAMGNTMPSLISSGARMTLLAIPLLFMSRMAGFQMLWIWYLSVATVVLQLGISLSLLRREFSRKLLT
ncbi:MAG TPA: MATE family efflux transporter [Longimicrobiales bacterium]|nr:MATE family efflux transporter [Longimicrobiales bacterium]